MKDVSKEMLRIWSRSFMGSSDTSNDQDGSVPLIVFENRYRPRFSLSLNDELLKETASLKRKNLEDMYSFFNRVLPGGMRIDIL